MAIIRDKKLLALALEWKANPKHAADTKFLYKGINYDYEEQIFPSARFQFQKYNSAYKNNKDFAEAFARDLHKRNSELIAEINKDAKTAEEQIYYQEQPAAQAQAEGTPAEQVPPPGEAFGPGIGLPTAGGAGAYGAYGRRAVLVAPVTKVPGLKVPGLKDTPETGLDYEGKPYQLSEEAPSTMTSTKETSTQKAETAKPAQSATGARRFQFPKLPAGIKSFGKNLLSNAQIFFKRNLVNGLAGFFGGLGGGLAFGGNPLGILGGAFGGVAGKSWLANGGFAKIGNGLVDRASTFSNLASGRISTAGNLAKSRIGLVLAGLFTFIIISAAASAIIPSPQTGQAAPVGAQPIAAGGGSLNSCKFTRAGTSNPVSSSKLLSIFQEVSAKSGVPASALATLAMHETQDFTANAKDDHSAFSDPDPTSNTGCKYFVSTKMDKDGNPIKIGSSSTGALGIMQVQPPKSIHDAIAAQSDIPSFDSVGAYSADGVNRGAQMIGKTADTLTLTDFCDIRTSVYLGAGVLISKNGGKPPTSGSEVNQSVCRYYGTCQYGAYNYGDEAQKDFENCKDSNQIAPAGEGGKRIAIAADQISSQLVHSTKSEDALKRLDLANAGISCAPFGTYGASYHCWIGMGNRPNQPYDQAGDADYLQCTEFVWAVFDKAGYGAQIDFVRRGNAYEWPDRARTQPDKFSVFPNPQELQPGDIISEGTGDNGGTAGHLAVVVARENNKVTVAQASTDVRQEDYFIEDGKLVINNVISTARCTPETRKGCRVLFIRLITQ